MENDGLPTSMDVDPNRVTLNPLAPNIQAERSDNGDIIGTIIGTFIL
jgi:hypothetical protein